MNELEDEIKSLIIESLDLEDISVEDIKTGEPLFGEGLGLDSIDALELGLALKERYGVTFDEDSEVTREHFYSVETLAKLLSEYKK
jgi:acyl carrier protein